MPLKQKNQVSLADIINQFPLENGLAELLAYLNLAFNNKNAAVNDFETEIVFYTTKNGKSKKVIMPQVIFTR